MFFLLTHLPEHIKEIIWWFLERFLGNLDGGAGLEICSECGVLECLEHWA